MNRKSILVLAIALAGCGTDNSNQTQANANQRSVDVGAFTTPLPSIPSVDGTKAGLVAQVVARASATGDFQALGYSTSGWLGPTLALRKGDQLGVVLQNQLSEATNLHWHGLTVPAELDGMPNHTTAAGATKTYSFPILQRAGMYWYHPHPDMATGRQVARGLAGLIRIGDTQEDALGLPSGPDEIPLVIQDKRFESGKLVYQPDASDVMTGWFGSSIAVNGALFPVATVRRGWVRFRLLNGSNARVYDLALEDGRSLRVIGSDGGLLASPTEASSLLLGPGERADVLVDFSGLAAGSATYLRSQAFAGGGVQGKQAFRILKIVGDASEGIRTPMPTVFAPLSLPLASSAVRTRTFVLDVMAGMSGMSGMNSMPGMHQINGKTWDPNRIDETVVAGETEIWEIHNPSDELHPFHVHGLQFALLDRRGGRGILKPDEAGWKDTFVLLPGETVRIVLTLPNNLGVFLLHCHNLEHEDDGMMLQFQIVAKT